MQRGNELLQFGEKDLNQAGNNMAEYVDAVATFFKADESMVLLQFFETVPRRTQGGEIQTKQEISASI